MLTEQLEYNLLFRWFVGLNMDDPVWDPTVFSKNRDRLLAADVAALVFLCAGRGQALDLVSDEHFTVDGTLLEAWASLKSFKKEGPDDPSPPADDPGNPTVDFHGETRTNATHASTTDPAPLSRNCTFRQIAIRVAAARRCCSRTSARTRTSSRCQRSCSTR